MFEVYFKEKNGKETILGRRNTLVDAEKYKKDSEVLAEKWEVSHKYKYFVREVK